MVGFGSGSIITGGNFGAPANRKKYCMTDVLKAIRKQETYPKYPGAGAAGMPKSEDAAQALKAGNKKVARNSTHRIYLNSGDWLGLGVVGDRGKALGPFQIHKGNYMDAVEFWRPSCMSHLRQIGDLCRFKGTPAPYRTLGEVSKDALDLSICVVLSYARRYSAEAFARLCNCKGTLADVERVARNHNGGPEGYKRDTTDDYWKEVEKYL